jgi:signal peptidase I
VGGSSAVGDPAVDGDPVTADADEHDHDHEPDKRKSFWRELPVLVLVALVLAFLIKTFLVQAFFIPSESMENTLLVGDRVLVNKLAYRFGDIERGDVIVFDGRGSFEPLRAADDDGTSIGDALRAVASSFGLAPGTESDYIKRVIGVGGDHVVCCDDDGRITVNDTPIDPEDYLFPGDVPSTSEFDITVPEDKLWVMGDHRSRSEDSRAHAGSRGGGFVPVDRVIGRAFVKVWPIGRWDTMPRPDAFDEIADTPPSSS